MKSGRPKPGTSDMALCGVYYALVTQNKDEEKSIARIKVRFPWMPEGDKDQSHWARVVVPAAGEDFGTFTLPEVDDTVVVMFVAGDIRFPVVIGGMWNNTDTPPEVNENGNNDFRFIKSRAGSRLLFDDSSKTKLVMTDASNANYVGVGEFAAGGDGPNKMELSGPPEINGSATKGVAVSSMEGTVNLWCPKGTLKIDAKNVEFTGGDKTAVKAGADLKLESGGMASVSASQAIKVDGSKVKVN